MFSLFRYVKWLMCASFGGYAIWLVFTCLHVDTGILSQEGAQPRLFYGFYGKTLGHTKRALALGKALEKAGYDVDFWTFSDGWDFLIQTKAWPAEKLHPIEGWSYTVDSQGMNWFRTVASIVPYLLFKAPIELYRMTRILQKVQPKAVLSDCEGIIAWSAKWMGIPLISIDSQHEFCTAEARLLPARYQKDLRWYVMGLQWLIPSPDLVLVSTFHPIQDEAIRWIPPILDPLVLENKTQTKQEHLLVYINHEEIFPLVAPFLPQEKTIIYGVSETMQKTVSQSIQRDNWVYKPKSYEGFLQDLAASKAVISTAGISLVGEALFLGKPLFVIPLPGQTEQYTNAHYLVQHGMGMASEIDYFNQTVISVFLRCAEKKVFAQQQGDWNSQDGSAEAVKAIQMFLEKQKI